MLKYVLHFFVVVEQAVAVQPLDAALFHLHGRWHKAVRADNLQVIVIPQNKVQIVIIVAVGIPALPAAFLHGTKGNLAQPPQLARHSACASSRLSVALSSGRAMAHWVLKTPGNPLPRRITC